MPKISSHLFSLQQIILSFLYFASNLGLISQKSSLRGGLELVVSLSIPKRLLTFSLGLFAYLLLSRYFANRIQVSNGSPPRSDLADFFLKPVYAISHSREGKTEEAPIELLFWDPDEKLREWTNLSLVDKHLSLLEWIKKLTP